MRIIPVIDLMNGRVVRGVAGQRDSYQAVESAIAAEPTPTSVAGALADRFGFDEVYVADLDAIGGLPPDERSCEEIAASGMRLWLDAGITDAARAKTVLEIASENSHIVVGLESIASPDDLQGVFSAIPGGRGVFSLDLKGGVPIANSTAWGKLDADDIANTAIEVGFNRMIVLDLAHVGTGGGIGVGALCQRIRERFPDIELISGGGVRDLHDLQKLKECGCDAALVASALHNAQLTADDVRAASRW